MALSGAPGARVGRALKELTTRGAPTALDGEPAPPASCYVHPRPMSRARAILASYVGVLLFSALLFLGAGKLAFWQGWLYVCVALVGTTSNHLLLRKGSDLTAKGQPGHGYLEYAKRTPWRLVPPVF